jgi:hypothetical protein
VRPLPQPCCQVFFRAIHSITHPGMRASKRMVASHFVWPGIVADVAAWCKDCQDCARGKTTVHAVSMVIHMELPFFSPKHVFSRPPAHVQKR